MEAQFIASVTADPKQLHAPTMRARWAAEFDSWDIVDGVSDLFVDTDDWRELIAEFAADEREFVRRTAFAMIAGRPCTGRRSRTRPSSATCR